jgi:class 3 adenylate cyclase
VTESRTVRYADSDGIEIAYRILGSGQRTVVGVPSLSINIDDVMDLDTHWSQRLSTVARVVLFDRRGQGLSGRTFGFGTAEDRMDDLRVVMDAADVEHAVLIGDHDGAAFAIMFAATYPERVTGLVLSSPAAPRNRWAPDYPIGFPDDLMDQFADWVGDAWGTGRVSQVFVAPEHPFELEDLARIERALCTPRMAAQHHRRAFQLDVRNALSAVRAPVLLVHGRDDATPIALSRYLLEHLPDAALYDPPGWALLGSRVEIADALDRIEEFVTGERPRAKVAIDRVLATVLFVDIVGSTERLAAIGDEAWRRLLDEFRALVRSEIERFQGREINTRGDDFLATFDGSTRAVRAASAIVDRATGLGVEVRAGLHTGEVELQENDVAGITVHVGARVGALAAPGEVLVTSTVRDLVVGSGLEFTDRGRHELKGVPGEWQVLAVQE